MTEQAQQEVIVRAGALDLSAYRSASGMGAKDIEGQSANNSQVLGRVVLSGSIGVFVEGHVEDPVQFVLDPQMRSHHLQQPLGRKVFGEQKIAYQGIVGRPPFDASARCNARHRDDAWELVLDRQAGVAHHSRGSLLAPIVCRWLELRGRATWTGPAKQKGRV